MERWHKIDEFENYEVSTEGQVRNIKTGRILKHGCTGGYATVCLCKDGKHKVFSVHRLVAEAFIPKSEGMTCVNHKDEDKTNNCVDNLEWCTYAYNINYGTRNKRVSNTMKGYQNFKGHRHYKSTKLKISATMKGRTFSEESKLKMKEARKRYLQNKKSQNI